MAIKNNPIVICNSSPIINLSKIGRLDLLEKLYQKIIIPDAEKFACPFFPLCFLLLSLFSFEIV